MKKRTKKTNNHNSITEMEGIIPGIFSVLFAVISFGIGLQTVINTPTSGNIAQYSAGKIFQWMPYQAIFLILVLVFGIIGLTMENNKFRWLVVLAMALEAITLILTVIWFFLA